MKWNHFSLLGNQSLWMVFTSSIQGMEFILAPLSTMYLILYSISFRVSSLVSRIVRPPPKGANTQILLDGEVIHHCIDHPISSLWIPLRKYIDRDGVPPCFPLYLSSVKLNLLWVNNICLSKRYIDLLVNCKGNNIDKLLSTIKNSQFINLSQIVSITYAIV